MLTSRPHDVVRTRSGEQSPSMSTKALEFGSLMIQSSLKPLLHAKIMRTRQRKAKDVPQKDTLKIHFSDLAIRFLLPSGASVRGCAFLGDKFLFCWLGLTMVYR